MPFKIYTYEDPYKLDKADFWNEISALPHFCSARTLVNGFKDVLGDKIEGLICPLDDLVNAAVLRHLDEQVYTANMTQKYRKSKMLMLLSPPRQS